MGELHADLKIDEGEKGEESKDKPTPKDHETEQYQGDQPDSEETQLA